MANITSMLQKRQKNLVLLMLSAIFSFSVSANPVPTSDDWEDWLEAQEQMEQAQLELKLKEIEGLAGAETPKNPDGTRCPLYPACDNG